VHRGLLIRGKIKYPAVDGQAFLFLDFVEIKSEDKRRSAIPISDSLI
jgi:hypothetical protein